MLLATVAVDTFHANLLAPNPGAPHSGCQLKTCNLVTNNVEFHYCTIHTVVLSKFDHISRIAARIPALSQDGLGDSYENNMGWSGSRGRILFESGCRIVLHNNMISSASGRAWKLAGARGAHAACWPIVHN